MITRGIRTFMSRDWQRARDAKDDLVSGFEAIARRGPTQDDI